MVKPTPRTLIRAHRPRLAAAGIEDPRHELMLLLAHLLQEPLARLLARLDDPVPAGKAEDLERLVQRRAAREPLAYLIGTAGFAGLELAVGPGVLVPRPDSECLVETAVSLVASGQVVPEGRAERTVRLLDTCTGSGAIGIAIARQLADAHCSVALHLLDQSPEALAYARVNSGRWCADLPVRLELGDLFPAEPSEFDLVTINPPYIADAVLPGLMPEVSRHEPALALAGGPDGLDVYRRILAGIRTCLRPGGWLLLEHGYDQAEAVAGLIRASAMFAEPSRIIDYGGNPRVAVARRLPAAGQSASVDGN